MIHAVVTGADGVTMHQWCHSYEQAWRIKSAMVLIRSGLFSDAAPIDPDAIRSTMGRVVSWEFPEAAPDYVPDMSMVDGAEFWADLARHCEWTRNGMSNRSESPEWQEVYRNMEQAFLSEADAAEVTA